MAKLFKSIKSRFTKKVYCHDVERAANIVVIGPRDIQRAPIVATFLKQTAVGRDIMRYLLKTETGDLHVELVDYDANNSSFLDSRIASGEIFILLSNKDVPSSNVKIQQIEATIRKVKGGDPCKIFTASAESKDIPNFNFPIIRGMNVSSTKTWRSINIHAASPDFGIIQYFLNDISSFLESRVRLFSP